MTVRTQPQAYLEVRPYANGPEIRCELVEERSVIGKHPSCHLQLDHTSISRFHAEIRYEDGIFLLEDLRSRPGTMLNGVTIKGPMMLHEGDEIRICERFLTFHWGE